MSLRGPLAAAPAIAAVLFAWTLLESPVAARAFVVAGALALVPAIPRDGRLCAAAAAGVALAILAATFVAWPPAALGEAWAGLREAPARQAPFVPVDAPALHGLVVVAASGLALVAAVGAARRRLFVVVAAVAAGVGLPSVLLEDARPVLLGLLALASVLWAALVLGAADVRRLLVGVALGTGVAAAAAGVALAGLSPGAGRLDWRGWDPFATAGTGDMAFLWDARYDGIDFPARPTVMLRVRAPARAEYWRVSTLDTFTNDRWIEQLSPVARSGAERRLPLDDLSPRRDARPGSWLRQEITVVSLDDTRVPAATEPARIDGPSLHDVAYMQGGVMVAARRLARGETYTVWSYAPRPTPRALAASPARYPTAARRYLRLESARLPPFGAPRRAARVARVFRDDRYRSLSAYRSLWETARRLTAQAASPYEATLVLERWFRDRGGFRYEEHPPTGSSLPPLVRFVDVTRAGYCQHYAGAMALMLRMLGIPSRVAVGFTAGTWDGGVWTVTDRQAHAWVEAWFAGFGWLAFDPTPGRGTLSAVYTLASGSAAAVRALATGAFLGPTQRPPTGAGARPLPTARDADTPARPWWAVATVLVPLGCVFALVGVKRGRSARRLRRGDPRALAEGVRAELVAALVDRGAELRPDATPAELRRIAERLLGVPASRLTDAVAEARYGPASRARAASERARAELHRVLAAAAAREALRVRLRAALSLRSFLRVSGR